MEIKTVGDLISYLTRFDQTLPVLKSDPQHAGYTIVPMVGRAELRIAPGEWRSGEKTFVDAEVNDEGSFNAIIL